MNYWILTELILYKNHGEQLAKLNDMLEKNNKIFLGKESDRWFQFKIILGHISDCTKIAYGTLYFQEATQQIKTENLALIHLTLNGMYWGKIFLSNWWESKRIYYYELIKANQTDTTQNHVEQLACLNEMLEKKKKTFAVKEFDRWF